MSQALLAPGSMYLIPYGMNFAVLIRVGLVLGFLQTQSVHASELQNLFRRCLVMHNLTQSLCG